MCMPAPCTNACGYMIACAGERDAEQGSSCTSNSYLKMRNKLHKSVNCQKLQG
ncbi:hypothetical protein MANES_08G078711v8 [Manihot esculenta]|uniref:Uncharacterized protein n=1 Tax=Manihot esculenta TaxID=3983 RepID=A0A2C9VEL3_MANES|nr:hypothetical protein MANES_08G078711v8 [Manihot esculenta]